MGLGLNGLHPPPHGSKGVLGDGRGLILEGIFPLAIYRLGSDTAALIVVIPCGEWIFRVRAFGAGGLGTRGRGALDSDFLDGLLLLKRGARRWRGVKLAQGL